MVLVTEWAEFKQIDPVWAATLVRVPIIIDGRNTLDAHAWRAAGWTYQGLGRPQPRWSSLSRPVISAGSITGGRA